MCRAQQQDNIHTVKFWKNAMDFSRIDLEELSLKLRGRIQPRTLGGQQTNVWRISTRILFPLNPGELNTNFFGNLTF